MPCRKKLQALSRFKPTWERNSAYDVAAIKANNDASVWDRQRLPIRRISIHERAQILWQFGFGALGYP